VPDLTEPVLQVPVFQLFVSTDWSEAMLGTILLVILILMLLGAMPTWQHSRNWGVAPSGLLGVVVVVVLILVLMKRI
jgi:Protein of unknown function (DUF3309)